MPSVRLIAGSRGGRLITAPTGRRTHPMGERARGALFNSLGNQVRGATVLDAFAGTGALGLEALSRDAVRCTFVERDRTAQRIITDNVATLGFEPQAQIIRTTIENWVATAEPQSFDIIFADPPYYAPQFSTVSKLLGLLNIGGVMVLSHPGRGEVPTKTGVVVVDNRSYGNAHLAFYHRES